MSSVRLRTDQIERLRKSGNAQATIRYALMRYQRGDFGNIRARKPQKGAPLAVFPLYGVIPNKITDAKLRLILDAHFKTPDAVRLAEIDREIAELDKQIAEMMKVYAVRPDRAFIFENDNEEEEA